MQSFNLTANPEELAEMGDRYCGHPKALQLAAALIRDDSEFQGNVGMFLHNRDWLLIRDIESAIGDIPDKRLRKAQKIVLVICFMWIIRSICPIDL